jgi:hypothetical protein
MVWACGTHRRDMARKPEGKSTLSELGVDVIIILKCMLNYMMWGRK